MRIATLVVGGLLAALMGGSGCSYDAVSNDFGPSASGYTESADQPSRPGRVIGTVAYRERLALPPGALVTVQLVDLVQEPYLVVSESTTSIASSQPPLAYALSYNVGEIDAQGRYGLRARITVDGQTWFASPQPTRIILSNELDRIGLIVARVDRSAP